MRLNQNGFTVLFVILGLVLAVVFAYALAAVGFNLYFDQDTITDETSTEIVDQADQEGTLYSNSYVTLSYPSDWTADTTFASSAEFSSPNYRPDIEKGDGSALEGARFYWFYVPDITTDEYIANLKEEQRLGDNIDFLEPSDTKTLNGAEYITLRAIEYGTASYAYMFVDPVGLNEIDGIERGGVSVLAYTDIAVVDGAPSLNQAEFQDEFLLAAETHRFVE